VRFLKLALTAFLKLVHRNDYGIVDEASKAESVGTLKPSCQVAQHHRCADERIIDVGTKVLANRNPNETQRTEHQTNGPGKTLGLGGLPELKYDKIGKR